MTDELKQDSETDKSPPRVLADFGGRRKIFDRRMKQRNIDHNERRAENDRRSGFDRRGALSQNNDDADEKRSDFMENSKE
jgi:hypothetical protein